MAWKDVHVYFTVTHSEIAHFWGRRPGKRSVMLALAVSLALAGREFKAASLRETAVGKTLLTLLEIGPIH